MIEQVLKNIKEKAILIDVWTGSSCIPISILKNTDKVDKCFVVDISKKALEVSKINIKIHKLESKIKQVNWSLLDEFQLDTNILCPNWDINLNNIIITANLPYIKNWDFKNMDKQTVEFEPNLALYWWKKTWFELYEKLIYQILELKSIYNTKSILLFIEIGFDQKETSESFINKLNLNFEIFKDNRGIHRCIKINF
jgi:release factor glutamine methyltransferase